MHVLIPSIQYRVVVEKNGNSVCTKSYHPHSELSIIIFNNVARKFAKMFAKFSEFLSSLSWMTTFEDKNKNVGSISKPMYSMIADVPCILIYN